MNQLPFLNEVIMGALWASSITALGILIYTLLLIVFQRSVIYRDLMQVKKMQRNPKLINSNKSAVSKPMQYLLQELGCDWQEQFGAYLTTTNEGIPVIASVLRPLSPLLGLSGTLYGIGDALAFVSSDPALVIQGFTYAIQTTLIGIFVSVLAHVTAAWIWAPYWKRQRYELFQTLSILHARIKQAHSKKSAKQQVRERQLSLTLLNKTQQRRNGNNVGTSRR